MSKMRFFALQELANRRPLEVITPAAMFLTVKRCRNTCLKKLIKL